MRILAVDPGEKRIGLALSDPTATLASPLQVLENVSRRTSAQAIAGLAGKHDCALIIVGQALNAEGGTTESSRRAEKLSSALRAKTAIPVILWDEGGSTQRAQAAYREMGVPQKKRRGHLDQIAATLILQSYLDAMRTEEHP